MVRWTRPSDYRPVMSLLQQARPGVQQFEGNVLIDEVEGAVVGVVVFILGKPDTLIRVLSVTPAPEASETAGALLNAVRLLAEAHGSLTIEGTIPPEWKDVLLIAERAGAELVDCVRARVPVGR